MSQKLAPGAACTSSGKAGFEYTWRHLSNGIVLSYAVKQCGVAFMHIREVQNCVTNSCAIIGIFCSVTTICSIVCYAHRSVHAETLLILTLLCDETKRFAKYSMLYFNNVPEYC